MEVLCCKFRTERVIPRADERAAPLSSTAAEVQIFDVALGKAVAACAGHTAPITDCEFFAGQGLLSCAQDGAASADDMF